MKSSLLVAAMAVLVALSGCTDKAEPAPALTEEDCAAQGMVLGTQESMDSNESADVTSVPACVPPGPPATVTIDGLPASTSAYSNVAFTWTLHTDSEDEMHTMDTQIRWANAPADEASLGKPDTFGEKLVQKEHQNFFDGQTYDAVFAPETSGTYYLRAFALVNGENLWSPEYILDVSEVAATGTGHTLTLSGGGLPVVTSISTTTLAIGLGDSVAWVTDDPAGSWTITSDTGPASFATTSGGDAIVFLIPGSYTYTADGTLSLLGGASGTIEVSAPSA